MINNNCSKRKVYLIQATGYHVSELPLPYSVGVLQAYASQNIDIKSSYVFEDIIFEKLPQQVMISKMKNPFVVAFSCYVWNYEYNKYMARVIKENYPNAIIVFGGHSVPISTNIILEDYKNIDYLLMGEGEKPFEDLLLCLIGKKDRHSLINTAILSEENIPIKLDMSYCVDDFPSPYLEGVFDSIINNYGYKYHFTATLETNRGCPFSCAYCDWGLNNVKLRKMSIDKIKKEIEWMKNNNIYTCYCADSNFGIFERDVEIVEEIIKKKKENNSPRKFYVSYHKNSDERVFRIARMLNENDMLQGATLSFQSLNDETLYIIGRKNMDLEYFGNLMRQYNIADISTYSEVILGLPLETYESFIRGIGMLIEKGQHRSIRVYTCELLPNSKMGQENFVKQYGIKTVKVPFRRVDIVEAEEITEYSNMIVQTSTMTRKDWARSYLFFASVFGMYSQGFIHCLIIYINNRLGLRYECIFERIINSFMNNKELYLYDVLNILYEKLINISKGRDNWLCNITKYNMRDISIENVIYNFCYSGYKDIISDIVGIFEEEVGSEIHEVAEYQEMYCDCRIRKKKQIRREFNIDYITFFDALYLGLDCEKKQMKITYTSEDMEKVKH